MSSLGDQALDLWDELNKVHDRDSFVEFLGLLGTDFALEKQIEAKNPPPPYSSGALGWENGSIDAFLEQACEWGKAKTPLRSQSSNPWRECAEIIHMGKVYE